MDLPDDVGLMQRALLPGDIIFSLWDLAHKGQQFFILPGSRGVWLFFYSGPMMVH